MTRRAPLTTDRAAWAADVLAQVADGVHPRTWGSYAEQLAAIKLGELYDEVGAFMVADPDLDRVLAEHEAAEAAAWLDPR